MNSASLLVNVLLCLFMVLFHAQGSNGCLEKERLGLLEIKNFFFGLYPIGNLQSWIQHRNANCCSWERVLCNHTTGRVEHLDLSRLDGRSIDIGMFMVMNFTLLHPFEQLVSLDLSDNFIYISIDIEGLCGMKNLQELDISNNTISLPKCMGNLTSLRVLDLSATRLTGNVPSFITSLKSLEYLSLLDNENEGLFSFSLLANHSKLEVIRLSSSTDNFHMETESSSWIPTFQLKALQLVNCKLNAQQSSAIPNFLLYQHELTIIDLSRNKLHGDFPVWLLNNNSNLEIVSN